MSVETPEAPSTPPTTAPVMTEPQAAPAADTSTPANPTSPAGEGTPGSVKLSRSNPLPTPSPEDHRKAAYEAMQKMARERGTQVVREPAAPTAATPTPAGKEEGAGNPAPKEAPPSKEPEGDKASKDAIVVKGSDKDGKAADVTITRAQAIAALLRNKIPAEAIAEWSAKRVLEIGSQQFLLQQENDRRWSQVAEERRRGPEAKESQPSPAAAATPPSAQAAKPEASTETPPAQTAQPTPAQSPSTPPTTDFEADFKAIEEEVGASAAAPFRSLFAKLAGTADKSVAAQQQRTIELESTVQTLKQVNDGIFSMMLDERFDRGFSDLSKDFPQLEGSTDEVKAIRADIRANSEALSASGRWKNPLEPGAFREIVREAAFARLGKQQQETHARQLLRRQQTQAAGQVPSNPSRTDSPAAALSDTDLKKRAMMEVIRTGDRSKGQKLMRDLQQASG